MVSESEKSDFNDAVGFLQRLDLYFRFANIYAMGKDVENWVSQLGVIFLELYNFVDNDEKDKKQSELKMLIDEVDKYTRTKNTNIRIGIPSDLYWRIFNFHTFLKGVYGRSGLETKVVDESMKGLK